MKPADKKVKYPGNLILKKAVDSSGYKIDFLAEKLGVSRVFLSYTINGHRKGEKLVKKLSEFLGY